MPSPISYKVSDHKVKLVLSIDRYASQRETTPVLRGLSFLDQMRRQMKDSPKKEEIREYFTRGFRPRCSDVDEPRDRVSHEEP